MELKLNIPTHLNEITLRQYKKFIEIGQNNEDPNFIQGKMIEIFCGVSHKFATLMRYKDVEEITGDINKLLLYYKELIDYSSYLASCRHPYPLLMSSFSNWNSNSGVVNFYRR